MGGSGDISLRNAESARKVLNSTFLVQEYVEGGNLRNQVLEQVRQAPCASSSMVVYCHAPKRPPLCVKRDTIRMYSVEANTSQDGVRHKQKDKFWQLLATSALM